MELRSGYREYAGFMPTSARALAPREPGCPVDVVLEGSPSRPHEVVGMVTAERVGQAVIEQGGGEEQAIPWLRDAACRAGAHVIFDVRTATEREAYVGRAIRGRALAAVYTDSGGEPSSPPPPAPTRPEPAPSTGGDWGTPPPDGAGDPPVADGPAPGDPEPPAWGDE